MGGKHNDLTLYYAKDFGYVMIMLSRLITIHVSQKIIGLLTQNHI